jgi:hypothetical protein
LYYWYVQSFFFPSACGMFEGILLWEWLIARMNLMQMS